MMSQSLTSIASISDPLRGHLALTSSTLAPLARRLWLDQRRDQNRPGISVTGTTASMWPPPQVGLVRRDCLASQGHGHDLGDHRRHQGVDDLVPRQHVRHPSTPWWAHATEIPPGRRHVFAVCVDARNNCRNREPTRMWSRDLRGCGERSGSEYEDGEATDAEPHGGGSHDHPERGAASAVERARAAPPKIPLSYLEGVSPGWRCH